MKKERKKEGRSERRKEGKYTSFHLFEEYFARDSLPEQ